MDSDETPKPCGWSAVNQELKALEGKTDEASNACRAELLDELITWDMALQPCRRAMGQGGKRKPAAGEDGEK
jgi:hypothetical protein